MLGPNFSAKALRVQANSATLNPTITNQFLDTNSWLQYDWCPLFTCFCTLCVLWLFQTCCIFTDISPRIFFTINSFCSLRLQKKWKGENVFKDHERCQPYGKRENVSKFCQRSLRGDVQPWDCACVHQHLEEGVQSKQCHFLRATQKFLTTLPVS